MTPEELEERTFVFAKGVRTFVRKLDRSVSRDDVDQIIRSSGSVGANYIEANESLGTKDFIMRLKICRKEAKETSYWFRIIEENVLQPDLLEFHLLRGEAEEFRKIFNASIRTLERQSSIRQSKFGTSMSNG